MCVRTHVQVCVHKCVPETWCAFTCACWGTYIVTHVAPNAGATVRIVHTLPYFDHEVKVLLRDLHLRGGIPAWEGEQGDYTWGNAWKGRQQHQKRVQSLAYGWSGVPGA